MSLLFWPPNAVYFDLRLIFPPQVLLVALLTGLIQYPNPYTRTNASQIIRKLFSQCGPTDNNQLWCVGGWGGVENCGVMQS